MARYDSSDKIKDLIKFVSVNGSSIYIECQILNGGKYAYYLYKNGYIIERIGYSDLNFMEFGPLAEGDYSIKVFYRVGESKHSIYSKKVKVFNGFIINTSSYALNPRSFDIHIFDNPYIKVIDQENNGFIGFGRNDLKAYKLKVPINWGHNPYDDRNWMFQLQAWRYLDAYLQCHFNEVIIDKISSIINDWVRFEKKTKNKSIQSWLWYDMSTGLRALKLTYYIIRCRELGVPHNIDDISYLIKQHLIHLGNIEELSKGNHGLFQLNGLMALCSILEDGTALSLSIYKSFALEQMKLLLKNQLGETGVHTENSPDYHFFSVRAIKKIINSSWWQKETIATYFNDLLKKSSAASNWFVDPNNRCVPIGDSSYSRYRANKAEGLLWPHSKKGKIIAAQLDGYAVIRTNFGISSSQSSFLFFQGSFYSRVHKHSDCLSFIWQEKGEYILTDGGKYGYQNDKYRKYFLSNRSHNTLIVDDLDYDRSEKSVYGSAIYDAPTEFGGWWILGGKVSYEKHKYEHSRILIYSPSNALYVLDFISNKKSSERKGTLNWMLERDINPLDKHLNILYNKELGNIIFDTVVLSDGKLISGEQLKKNYFHGQDDKLLSGWISDEYLKVEPTGNIQVNFNIKNQAIVLTKFLLKPKLAAPICLNNGVLIYSDANIQNIIENIIGG